MFEELFARTRAAIDSVRSIVKANEELRSLLFAEQSGEPLALREKLIAHVGSFPNPTLWRVHDHCAAVTRLYGIYERFIVEIVRDWLALLPGLVDNYEALSESVHREHRKGVARVLQNLGSTKFRHLSAYDAVRGFHEAVSGSSHYELLPEAFALREQNYRHDILQAIFSSVAIQGSWAWIQAHKRVRGYIEDVGADSAKAEIELEQFVQQRNDAARGVVDEVLSVSRLVELCDLVEALCEAVSELMASEVVKRRQAQGSATEVGTVTEKFRNGAVVAKMSGVEFGVGDGFYVCGKSCCYSVTVTSIRINDVPMDRAVVTNEAEVGLVFSREVSKNRSLVRLVS